jgi:rhodanese-related sulfurtransferase
MNRTILQALTILALSFGMGLGWNLVSPRGIPLVAEPGVSPASGQGLGTDYLTMDQAEVMWRGGATLFLDARDPADYEAGHIGNAMNLPVQSFAGHFGMISPMITPESPMVLYCDGLECELGHRLRVRLLELGYTNTHLLHNGWTAWREAGLPVTRRRVE